MGNRISYYNNYAVQQFLGIQQHYDGSLLPYASASDARNMETKDGNLSVAKGYEKLVNTAISGSDKLLKIIVPHGYEGQYYVVGRSKIYGWYENAWHDVYSFGTDLSCNDVSYLQTKVWTDECVLIGTGETQIIKIDLATHAASVFGSGETIFPAAGQTGAISSYDASTKTITFSDTLTFEMKRRAYVDGVTWTDGTEENTEWGRVLSYGESTNTLVLEETPTITPTSSMTATIRGGCSDAHVHYIDVHYNRMFSAGDPSAPSRLYWSSVPGDGRTYADWSTIEEDDDASGGYVEVGETDGDAIVGIEALSSSIIIFKRYSVWRLYGDRPTTYTLERIDRVGLMMSNSSVNVLYDQPFWMTKNGVYYWSGSSVSPIDGGVQYLMKFLNSVTDVSNSRGALANNRMYFTCKVGISEYDNAIVQYDLANQAYMIRSGFNIADITAFDGRVFLLTDSRYVYEFERGNTYDGAQIEAYWCTQPTDLGAKYQKKQLTEIVMRADGEEMRINVIGDEVDRQIERLIHFADDGGYYREPFMTDQSRRFSIKFSNVAGSWFSILGGFDISYEPERK